MERIKRKILADGRIEEEVTYSDSARRLSRYRRPDGSLVSEIEHPGREERIVRVFYPSGSLKGETQYFRNLYHGRCARYTPSGEILFEGTLTYGNGTVRDYDDEGKLQMEYTGENGGERQMLRIFLPGGGYRTEYWIGERKVTRKRYLEAAPPRK